MKSNFLRKTVLFYGKNEIHKLVSRKVAIAEKKKKKCNCIPPYFSRVLNRVSKVEPNPQLENLELLSEGGCNCLPLAFAIYFNLSKSLEMEIFKYIKERNS